MFIGPCIIAIVEEWKTNLMSLLILFHLLCAQHVSDINISIFRSLRLCWWMMSSASTCKTNTTKYQPQQNSNTQRTENKTTNVVIYQQSRRLLKMDILMSETCWAHNKWNKIKSDIKLVFHSSKISVFVRECYEVRNKSTSLNNRYRLTKLRVACAIARQQGKPTRQTSGLIPIRRSLSGYIEIWYYN